MSTLPARPTPEELADALRELAEAYADMARDLDPDPDAEPVRHPELDRAHAILWRWRAEL